MDRFNRLPPRTDAARRAKNCCVSVRRQPLKTRSTKFPRRLYYKSLKWHQILLSCISLISSGEEETRHQRHNSLSSGNVLVCRWASLARNCCKCSRLSNQYNCASWLIEQRRRLPFYWDSSSMEDGGSEIWEPMTSTKCLNTRSFYGTIFIQDNILNYPVKMIEYRNYQNSAFSCRPDTKANQRTTPCSRQLHILKSVFLSIWTSAETAKRGAESTVDIC